MEAGLSSAGPSWSGPSWSGLSWSGGPSEQWVPRPLVQVLVLVQLVLFGSVFVFVYVQLFLVLKYGHKRLSFQTCFLGLVLLWAGLRTLMVSFYFGGRAGGSGPGLSPGLYWVLYGLPVCLQFMTLSLMTLYCAQVYLKAKSKSSPALLQHRTLLYLIFVFSALVFVAVNLVCGLLVRSGSDQVRVLVLVRVLVNDSLFVVCAATLAFCLHKVARMSLAIGLNSKGPSVCQLTLVGLALVLVYGSRTSYNLTVLSLSDHSPGSGPASGPGSRQAHWYHVTDQADLCPWLGDSGVLVLGLVLFVWELLPSALAVFFFRVRKPPHHMAPGPLPHVLSSRPYFFDNPHRYDSDEDLSWSHGQTRVSSECDFSDEQHLTRSSGELHPYP